MATPPDPKQVVSFEELLMSQVVQQEPLSRLLVEKGIFTKEEFLGMVKVIDRDWKKKEDGRLNGQLMSIGRSSKKRKSGDEKRGGK